MCSLCPCTLSTLELLVKCGNEKAVCGGGGGGGAGPGGGGGRRGWGAGRWRWGKQRVGREALTSVFGHDEILTRKGRFYDFFAVAFHFRSNSEKHNTLNMGFSLSKFSYHSISEINANTTNMIFSKV